MVCPAFFENIITAKFSLSIRIGLRQVKRQSSNPKSERYFWVNSDFIEGNLKHKKRRTNSCESILRLRDRDRIRTYDRLLRRQMLYPAELRDRTKYPCKSGTYKGFSGETGIRTQATLSR